MTDPEAQKRLDFAIDLARRAGEFSLTFFRELDKLSIESKGHQDLVSNGDREVELFVRAEIAKAYPDDGIVGEEHAPVEGTSGHVWVIDPIDGTANFVRGIPQWCVIIACMKDGQTHTGVVHEPVNNETFYARVGAGAFVNGRPIKVASVSSIGEGAIGTGFNNRTEAENILPVVAEIIRGGGIFFRNASGGLMLAYVASGRLIGYTEEHMNAWDCVAALLIVQEAGGECVPYSRGDVIANGTVVIAGAPGVFEWIRAVSFKAFGLA
ncbi:MAG: inositol monophosphatase family protein [Rhizobiaceae bacterium]|nr:inositol monophosphatase family protein [Rhizobiaceae bacterium]